MGPISSQSSTIFSTSPSLTPIPRIRPSIMTLSVSAVSPTNITTSRASSADSSLGPSGDPATTPQQRSKKKVTHPVFPYAPATLSHSYTVASEAEPLKSIPLSLIPKDTMPKLPPILHFGWSIDQDKLLEWCATEGFWRTTTDINGHYVPDHTGTVAGAFRYFAQRSGAGMFEPYIQLTCHKREPVIVALTSNYTVSNELDGRRREIFALGSLLFNEGLLNRSSVVARWYIDLKEWKWVVNR